MAFHDTIQTTGESASLRGTNSGKLLKKASAVALTVAASASVVLAAPTAAQAATLPSGCSIQSHPVMPSSGRVSYCSGGAGYHRIVLTCYRGTAYSPSTVQVAGDWVRPGSWSAAACWPLGFYRGASIGKLPG